jgi:hypothetical protein
MLTFGVQRKKPPKWAAQSTTKHPGGSISQVVLQQHLEQLIPVQPADEGAGVVVIGDIGGVLREDIPYDLVDGVISLFLEGIIYGGQDILDLRVLVTQHTELTRII